MRYKAIIPSQKHMPQVGNKKFPYTKKGKAQAKRAKLKSKGKKRK